MAEGDTYEHAKKVGNQQAKEEEEVRAELNQLEVDVLGIWNEFFEFPYGNGLIIRIHNDLPMAKHNLMMRLLDKIPDEVEENENPFANILIILTDGLYDSDSVRKQDTDRKFWENPNNWSMLRVRQIVQEYLKNYRKEMEKTASFPDGET